MQYNIAGSPLHCRFNNWFQCLSIQPSLVSLAGKSKTAACYRVSYAAWGSGVCNVIKQWGALMVLLLVRCGGHKPHRLRRITYLHVWMKLTHSNRHMFYINTSLTYTVYTRRKCFFIFFKRNVSFMKIFENSGNNHDYSYHTISLKYFSSPTSLPATTNPPGQKSNPASVRPGR